jgi:hypothetical protein
MNNTNIYDQNTTKSVPEVKPQYNVASGYKSSLVNLADNLRTDKNTCHSYLPLYESLFSEKKTYAKNILEIGIFHGGSIKLWRDYFDIATIHGLDMIEDDALRWTDIKYDDRINLYTGIDAYDETFFNSNFLSKNIKFDVMLDDGPHSVNSQQKFIQLYSQLLTENGILIVEDVQSPSYIEELNSVVPDHLKNFVKVYDLRKQKGRYDDLIFTIDLRL